MRILVGVASKHGATREIAEAIGAELRARGFEADVTPIERAAGVEGYDACVLGSAVYMGHWLKPAREFVAEHAATIAGRPTWLFSSGPIGEPPRPSEDPVDVAEIAAQVGARGHRLFAGALERRRLSFVEKAVVVALRAPEGDFRDWAGIRGWAREIATALEPAAAGQR